MPAVPQFGGTNSVPELNIGQTDSARYNAGSANFAVSVTPTTIDPRIAESPVPQQAITFHDVLGPAAGRVLWAGNLRVNSAATLDAIASDLSRYTTGYSRTSGVPGAFSAPYIKATRLTDAIGRILSERARMVEAVFTSPPRRVTSAPWIYIVPLRISFAVLQ